jgi:hypothetical protein
MSRMPPGRRDFPCLMKQTDEEKAEARKEWFETDMPEMLERLSRRKETGSSG